MVARITGYGQDGPYAARPAFGTLIEAMSGFAAMTGEPGHPPTLPPFGLADEITGISAALAVMMALYARDASGGTGQVIDLAILEPLVSVVGAQATVYEQLGEIPTRMGNDRATMPLEHLRDTEGPTRRSRFDWSTRVAKRSSSHSVTRNDRRGVAPDATGRVKLADLLDRYVAAGWGPTVERSFSRRSKAPTPPSHRCTTSPD